ncbi:MAG: RlmE family RNA methyltransferase [Alphaproteobacteria bacterium]|nr:RlmE family RNA methyltransferase [Alphaproteobacteria bacterium]
MKILKDGKQRTISSRRWLERQLSDPFVAEAKRQGYRSRAALKLVEMEAKAKLLRPGRRVVDLGAAPGGWTQVAVERVNPASGKGVVVAIDIAPMAAIGDATVLELDAFASDAPQRIREALGGSADVLLSDMAPPSTGHGSTDHLRSMALSEAALALADDLLRPGGGFLVKILQGGGEVEYERLLRRKFEVARRLKPVSSRADSREIYMLGTGFRGPGVG